LFGDYIMAGFDKDLDKELWSKMVSFERSVITVSVMSYNEGIAKLQIARQNKNAEGELSFAKLGRMTKEEVAAVLPLVQEAQNKM